MQQPQSTAEQDMELIRNKRATSTAGAAATTGQPKSKYRKRSVSLYFEALSLHFPFSVVLWDP